MLRLKDNLSKVTDEAITVCCFVGFLLFDLKAVCLLQPTWEKNALMKVLNCCIQSNSKPRLPSTHPSKDYLSFFIGWNYIRTKLWSRLTVAPAVWSPSLPWSLGATWSSYFSAPIPLTSFANIKRSRFVLESLQNWILLKTLSAEGWQDGWAVFLSAEISEIQLPHKPNSLLDVK